MYLGDKANFLGRLEALRDEAVLWSRECEEKVWGDELKLKPVRRRRIETWR